MRKHILTESERNIIERYLDAGEKPTGFKILLPKVKSMDLKALGEDLKLIAGLITRNPSGLDAVLIELLAYVGDQLSAYQDAVATEAYLETARTRISVARHPQIIQTASGTELLNTINERVNILHQDIERLYNEWFIEDTPPWSGPYTDDIKETLETFNSNLANFSAKMKIYLKKDKKPKRRHGKKEEE